MQQYIFLILMGIVFYFFMMACLDKRFLVEPWLPAEIQPMPIYLAKAASLRFRPRQHLTDGPIVRLECLYKSFRRHPYRQWKQMWYSSCRGQQVSRYRQLFHYPLRGFFWSFRDRRWIALRLEKAISLFLFC